MNCNRYIMFLFDYDSTSTYIGLNKTTIIILALMLTSFASGFLTAFFSGWVLKLMNLLLYKQ